MNSLFYEVGGSISTISQTPFWLRTNQYGTQARQSPFGLLKVGGENIFGTSPYKPQLKLEGEIVFNLSKESKILLPVGAITFRYRGLEIYAGRRKEVVGLGDTLMSSGFYIWSGNALPLPKIQIGTTGFLPLRFTKDFLSFQANFSHGWFGQGQFAYGYYLHQKSLNFRFGKPQNRVKFYIGGNHFAQWGGFAPLLIKYGVTSPNGALPSSWKDYLDIITVKDVSETSTTNHTLYQVGNQLGTTEALLKYSQKSCEWLLYFQHGIESRGFFKNLTDGLYGVSWTNKSTIYKSSLNIRHIIFEFLNTLNQNTQFDKNSNNYYNDDYFNHPLQYLDGWSYRQRIIGTPFITMRYDTRPEWADIRKTPGEDVFVQINNNRLWVLYGGMQGNWREKTTFKLKLSTGLNYLSFNTKNGTYSTATSQFSGYFEIKQLLNFPKRSYFQAALGYDQGQLLPSSFGGYIGFRQNLY